MTRYGILDDFGDVIRLLIDKPSSQYRYITKLVKRNPAIDWTNFTPAPF